MSTLVRSSKFRHVYGTAYKPDKSFQEIRVSRSAWDSNLVAANSKYFSVCWDAGGGGSFLVHRLDQPGRVGKAPLFTGHKGTVLDTAFNPFNDQQIASSSEDGTVCIWNIPEDGSGEGQTAVTVLEGHERKVGNIYWHPLTSGVIASSSTDATVRIWDVEKATEKVVLEGHGDFVQSCSWSDDGANLVTSCKDKNIRIFDARQGIASSTWHAHDGIKGCRVQYLGNRGKIFTVGFSRQSEREFCVWDEKNLSKPLTKTVIDTSSGMFMPFWDDDISVMFLAGKGDGNIRYYEYSDKSPYMYSLSEYKTSTPQRGMARLPKTSMDTKKCEVQRMLKLEKNQVVPIEFRVPRKSEIFAEDIFPPTLSPEPTMTAEQWFSGENNPGLYVSLKNWKPGTKGQARAGASSGKSAGVADTSKSPADRVAEMPDDPKFLKAQLQAAFETINRLS